MTTRKQYNYIQLSEPIPISEQKWPEGTLPLVATGTLTYNHEPFIRECIDSILMQKTTFPVRVCIFEDCSTDKTSDILYEYKEKYPDLIYLFCQPINTYSDRKKKFIARQPYNDALHVAKYIALCEGDDHWIDPLKLNKQVTFMETHDQCVLTFHKYYTLNQKSELQLRNLNFCSTFNQLEYAKVLSGIHTLTVVYRNILTEEDNKVLKESLGSYFLFLKISDYGYFKYFDEAMAVYRVHEGGVYSGKTFVEQSLMSLQNKSLMIRAYKHNNIIQNELIRTYIRFSLSYAFQLISKRHFKHSICFFSRSFKYGFKTDHILSVVRVLRRKAVNRNIRNL